MASHELHVIFGTGPLAMAVMRALQKREKKIRMINRSGRRAADIPPTVEVVAGDAYDLAFTRTVTAGAAVVYQCASPSYQDWPQKFPALQTAVLEGTAVNNARLIVAENLYLYGDTNGLPMTEELPYAAQTRKGQVRAALSQAIFAAHRQGKVQAATARGSDFYGPGVRASAIGERVFAPAVQGKKAQFTGRLDLPHTVTFIDDFGEVMAILGEREEALGHAWHVPNDRPTITQQEFGELIFAGAGHPPQIGSMGRWTMRLAGLFVPAAREVVEMMYQFEKPFVVDSRKFEQAFQLRATPIPEGVRQTIAWYKQQA